MKKIITTIYAVLLFIAAYAQVDLEIQFANYSNGETFSNDTIKTAFIIKNLGATTYNVGDTFYVNAKVNGTLRSLDLFTSNASPIILNKVLQQGDTLLFNPGILLGSQTLPFFPGATTLEICMILWGEGLSSVNNNYGGDTDTINNTTCATFDPSFTTSVENLSAFKNEVVVFPNPAKDKVQFVVKNDAILTKLFITDLSGKVITTVTPSNKEEIVINVTNWSIGIYFFKMQMGDGKFLTGKFIVNN